MAESFFSGALNRLLQIVARFAPGATTFRVQCHRLRGVSIGCNVWIGYDCILETSQPNLILIGNTVALRMRDTIIGHFKETKGVTIEDDVFIGPCVTILPGVKIGKGAVVIAGSIVTQSVAEMTVVQGNPAKAIARCGLPLSSGITLKKFASKLRKI